MGTKELEVEPPSSSNESVMKLLPEIIKKCYLKLKNKNNDNHKYVLLMELEREIKSVFRDTTPFEFDVAELNYVCFQQLLLLQFGEKLNIEIVFCEKRIMSLQYGDCIESKPEKIKKGGREYDACPDIECFVIINDENSDHKKCDGDKEEDAVLDNVKYLKRCNVVQSMSADDVYYHLKLIHSQRSMHALETEANGHHSVHRNANHHHQEEFNSFDEIAHELRENNIDGTRILNMQWSDWEMLHDLNRFDGDHQDFVEDIVMDFFFPFITGQQLSNQIASSSKYNAHCSIFDDEQMPSVMTLCIDYALFYKRHPIFQFFIKKTEVEDCNKLLTFHHHLSVDEVMGDYSAMHIAAWRGKFKLLAYLTNYGGDPMKKNKQGETALESGSKYPLKLKWFIAQFPEFVNKQ